MCGLHADVRAVQQNAYILCSLGAVNCWDPGGVGQVVLQPDSGERVCVVKGPIGELDLDGFLRLKDKSRVVVHLLYKRPIADLTALATLRIVQCGPLSDPEFELCEPLSLRSVHAEDLDLANKTRRDTRLSVLEQLRVAQVGALVPVVECRRDA